jgi:glycosyltransferase involved in cell wall biosynthesis
MKILQIGKFYPPFRGGMETVLENLMEGLLDAGVSVNTLVSGLDTTDRNETIQSPKNGNRGKILRAAKVGQWNSQPLNTTLLSLLRRQLETFEPDLVHLHLPNPLATLVWSTMAQMRADRMPPLAIWHHADITRQKLGARIVSPFVRKQLAGCAGICVSTGALAKNSKSLAGFSEKVEVIPFGIRPEPWIRIKAERTGPFLFVGRLVPYKGLQVLLEALKRVPASRLDIVGEGPLKNQVEQEIRQGELAGRVNVHGFCDTEKLVSLMTRARALVLPSLDQSETFGLVQLEAMASGVPVIASKLSTGVAEVGLAGETCLLVPPGNSRELAGVLQKVLEDDELVHRLGVNSCLRFQNNFTRDTMVQRVLAWYHKLLFDDPPKGRP